MHPKRKEIAEDVYSVIDTMKKYMGIEIHKSKYPKIKITGKRGDASYVASTNTIEISSVEDLMSGRVIGEEVGHYMREMCKPENSNEIQTDEFFGYLGARILYEIAKKKGVDDKLFPKGRPDYRKDFIGDRSSILQRLGSIRKKIKDLEVRYSRENSSAKKHIKKEGRQLVEEREEILHHFRPYKFASLVDLEKLDFKELYRLDDNQVRKKYFRTNALEKSICSLFFISLFLSTLFGFFITGNVIGNSVNLGKIFGVLSFVFCLFLIYLLLKD